MLKALCTLVLVAGGLAAQPQVTYFSASLDGGHVVPPTPSTARAWATARLDASSGDVFVYLKTRGLAPSAVYLRQGAPGTVGTVLLALTGGPEVWTVRGTLTPAEVATLTSGSTYLELYTSAFPGGEIRGQLVVPSSSRFRAALDGLQETPPVATAASGNAVAFLHEPDGVLTYTVSSQGLQNVTAAHVHQAPPGLPGPVLFPLEGAAGSYCGAMRLSASQLTALKAGQLYFNIHTQAHSGGEIRGQILPVVDDFVARLDGAQQVPPAVSSAVGQACLSINANGTVSYTVRVQGLQSVTTAEVRRAAPGATGPVVFTLSGASPVFSGTSPALSAAELADARNGVWYVSVATLAQPGGEIRGQVLAAELPTTYGGACPDSAGNLAEAGADGAPCIGAGLLLTLHDGPPGMPAAALLGTSRDVFGALVLPVRLSFLAAPDCHLLHDLLPVSLPATTDGLGCAQALLSLLVPPSLRGIELRSSWLIADPGAPGGFVTSNAVEMVLQ